jgi:ABC-type glycerol-3-phosphate transport system permease component
MTRLAKKTLKARSGSNRPRKGFSVGRGLAWAYVAVVVIVTVFPFYWILRTSLSNNFALATHAGSVLPVDFTLGPFKRALGLASAADARAEGGSGASLSIPLYLRNSLIYAGSLTVLSVFFSTIAAYAFARLRWRGRNLVFTVFLSALMIPGILTLLPNFVLIKQLSLLNSFAGLVLPEALFSAFGIFFLRQFMLALNAEVEEAAIIDGASRLRILFQITAPMSSGPIVTLAILTFIRTWNDYFWPLMVTTGDTVKPLTLALAVFKQSSPQSMPDWAGLMAATLIAALPMLVIFMIFGRRIVNSIGFTGIR